MTTLRPSEVTGRSLRISRRLAAASIALVFTLLPAVAAPAADAADATPVTLSMTLSSPDAPLVYGDTWNAVVAMQAPTYCKCDVRVEVLVDDDVFTTITLNQQYNPDQVINGYVGSYDGDSIVQAGNHELTARVVSVTDPFNMGYQYSGTSAPIDLDIGAADVTTDLLIAADPINADRAILTARLLGHFIERMPSPAYLSEYGDQRVAMLPAGKWTMSVTDQSGAEVWTREIPVEENGYPALSAVWDGVPRGSTFTGTASFVPDDSDDAESFTFAPAAKVSYTSAPLPASGEPAQTPADEAVPADQEDPTGLPVWALGGAALLAIISVVALVVPPVLGRRRRRRIDAPEPSLEESVTDQKEVSNVR
jgi:hypothetical protein